MNKAIFLDRDGTIIVDKDYLAAPDGVELLPGAANALRRLRDAGFLLVVVTNQSGIGRGYFTPADAARIHARIDALLAPEGAAPDAYYYCPHAPEDGCACRKPRPGLITRAAQELAIDPARSYMIGDKPSDLEAGHAAGCNAGILISPDSSTESLAKATDWILENERA